jgi:membrane fusion protein (multidrug efflux system)
MARRIIYLVVSLGILFLAFIFSSFLIKNKPVPPKDETQKNLLEVKTEQVAYTDQQVSFTRRGRVYSYAELPLSSQVGGKIEAGDVPLKVGASFSKGDLLFKIYDEDFKASLRSQRSSLVQALAGILPDMKIDYPAEYPAWQAFFSSIKIDEPLPELPEITSESLRVFLASKGTLTSYYSIQQSEITFKKYRVYAPFNGTYQNVQMLPGSVINPGTMVASLLRTDLLEITIPIEPEKVPWLTSGQQVNIQTNDKQTANGRIDRISKFVDAGTQTLNVYVSVKHPDTKYILSGSYVNIDFDIDKQTKGMLIPREAIVNQNEVYVIENGKLNKQEVEIITELEDQVIINGIDENVTIVVESIVDAKIGDEVIALPNS